MSNIISFPTPSPAAEHSRVGASFLAEPTPHSHAVQFYEDDTFLCSTVTHFLGAGLRAGERLLVIATAAHRDVFVERLAPHDVAAAIASGQLCLLDAEEVLASFMVDGMPDPGLFRQAVSTHIQRMRSRGYETVRIRAYGEMVDLLWRDGNASAALRLEELWNDLGREHAFELLCAYVMENFYREGDSGKFLEICRSHSHVMPTEHFQRIDDPHTLMREISVLQQRARALESEIQNRKELESALREALRERTRLEEELRACAEREQEARALAEASDAFKEMFLGILGHDLRNPLNTVLTTSRLMALRNDIGADNTKRLGRIVSSGVRMQRMINQLLDVTRLRLGAGIPVARVEQDLVALVVKIVEELRACNPDRTFTVHSTGECVASFDPARLEQVASNLLGNALMHGDRELPIEVTVAAAHDEARITVENRGPPIPPSRMPMLFDPFERGDEQLGPSDGLGLGLHISEQIMAAHGGRIEVTSSAEAGTRFEAWFPRVA